ncbi:unnamed protein product, partial [Adineta ricciae]
MPGSLKAAIKGGVTKTKEQPMKKKKKSNKKQIVFIDLNKSSSSSSSTSHQQHHSAPPAHNQQSKTGLDAINEHGEDSSPGDQQSQQKTTHPRFPRSSTVPYPAYATVRKTASHYIPPTYYYYTEDGQFDGRQPLPIINTGFQPISPHHPQYVSRPVDVLKPTFLIVPKATEQRLIAQLSASNSPVLTANKTKSAAKVSQKSPTTTTATTNESPTKNVMDIAHQHIGLLATPNPSPYVHFVNIPQSPELPAQEGPPETTIMHDEFSNLQEYQQPQPSTSIRSMPNIALAQVSPHHLYGSPSLRHYYLAQQPTDEQQILTTSITESTNGGTRSATVPQMLRTTDGRIGELDESSLASFDLAHTDIIDMPGSWRYQPVPIRTIARRYRQPIPQSFLDSQQYVSDSEQILHSSSYRQPQLFGSIPTINRPFDSIRSLQPIAFPPSIRLSDKDILKIAAFYKSMGTLVYVAHSTATLYSSDFDSMANLKDWKKLYTGVPIWLFNTGMNPKRARSIRLIISELGSSFTLWDTIVNGASDVRLPKSRHITLKSLETGAVLALKFDDTNATDEFHQYFVKLSCDPRNADLFDVF